MLDWDAQFGLEMLPATVTLDGNSDDGTWLPQPKKAGLDIFEPMSGAGDVTDLPPVDVTADPDPDPYDDWWETGGSPGGDVGVPGGGSGGGGGGGPSLPPVDDEEDCGPPADGPTPQGVDINALRDEARRIAADIAARNDDWEWGAIIYVLNGELHSTSIVTQRLSDSIGFNYSSSSYIPDGAHVVAWVHSHPYAYNAPNQDYMSERDEGARQTMVDNANGRYTVDPALMSYLLDNERDELLSLTAMTRRVTAARTSPLAEV